MKLLIPVDGSEASTRAVAHAITRIKAFAGQDTSEVHLLNVQAPLRGSVGMFLGGEDIKDYHREEGIKALEEAQKLLEAASVKYHIHIEVGQPAQVIDRYARELQVDEIIMGTRGMGNLADMLLGSTSEDVLRQTSVPVLLVK
jgi:nucleotide-binding universal stress UspA family protein